MFSKFIAVMLLVALATGGVVLVNHEIDAAFEQRIRRATELHQHTKAELMENHAKLLAEGAVQSNENVRRRRDEWIRVFGSPVESAVRNPELNITEMLEQLGLACAPEETRCSVKVEHFIEFELTLDFKNLPARDVLGGIMTCVLSRAAAYLHSIRVTQNGVLYAELTPEALYSVPNWADINPDEAAARLTFVGDVTSTSQVAAVDSRLPTLLGGGAPREESEKDKDPTLFAYETLVNRHGEAIDRFVNALFEAYDLQQYPAAETLQAKLDQIQVDWANIQPSQDFLRDPVPQLELLLKESGKLPLEIKILLRGERQRVEAKHRKQEARFGAIQAHLASTTGFLKAMLGQWGQWSTMGNRVQFSSREAQQEYRAWSDRLKASADRYNAAMSLPEVVRPVERQDPNRRVP